MAIVQCPECGGTLSTLANQCVHCGARITVCPQCQTVWAGEGNFCTNCGFNVAQPQQNQYANQAQSFANPQPQFDQTPNVNQQPWYDQNAQQPQNNFNPNTQPNCGYYGEPQKPQLSPIEDMLSKVGTNQNSALMTQVQKDYPGGMKFLFKVFGIASAIFFGFAVISPLLCMILKALDKPALLPTALVAVLAPVALYLAEFAFSVNLTLGVFNTKYFYHRFEKIINESNFDVNNYIRYELSRDWNTLDSNSSLLRKNTISVLIISQARKSSTYLNTVQYVIGVLSAIFIWTPAIFTIGNLFFLPLISNMLGINALNNEFSVVAIMIALIVFMVILIIFTSISTKTERKILIKWLDQNMPGMSDLYAEKVFGKKKK